MRKYTSGTRWCVWRWTDIVLGGLLYLRRLHLVQTPWFAVMLHWIMRPDPQPDLHDHPVSFLSVPLVGQYIEQTPTGYERHDRLRLKRTTDRHRIVCLVGDGPCLTLVFAGPVREPPHPPSKDRWGFHTPNGWVGWREYSK